MAIVTDKQAIRTILSQDPGWSLYALGDLAPGLFERAKWWCSDDDPPALVLLYRAFETPVLFTIGMPDTLKPLLTEIEATPSVYLHMRAEVPPLLEESYRIAEIKMMWRMVLDPSRYQPCANPDTVRLGPSDALDIQRLFSDGEETGESPDFYTEEMLEDGCFFGIRSDGELVAVAGTHLVAQQEGVAAVGCVYTRRDQRGRGLAACATSAVVDELIKREISTIGLNVGQRNLPAIRIYERLGFRKHCEYCEGIAYRK